VLRASEVGASHQRARLFILAHRKGERLGETWPNHGGQPRGTGGSGPALAHGESKRRNQGRPQSDGFERGSDVAQCGGAMADAGIGFVSEPGRSAQERAGAGPSGTEFVGEPDREREPDHEACAIPREDAWGSAGGPSRIMADPGSAGCEGGEFRGACNGERFGPDAPGSVAKLCGPYLFAPGPKSDLWPDILATMSHLAPATEPGVRVLVDGVACVVDESRADALRCAGNGVLALQAAAAFRYLAQRLG
jgi:DNA (cytosine-5)-methyltransferase 1